MYKFKREAFKALCKNKGVVYDDIAKNIGISLSGVASWMRADGKRQPNDENIKALAKFLNIKIEEIAELDDDFKKLSSVPISYRPIIGSASCGVPQTYYYDGDYEMMPVPDGVSRNAYGIRADGDSMTPRINHGDLVLCDPDAIVESGMVVHFEWDGEHGIKRYVEQGELRMMMSTNQTYPPLIITNEFELRMVRCIKVVAEL